MKKLLIFSTVIVLFAGAIFAVSVLANKEIWEESEADAVSIQETAEISKEQTFVFPKPENFSRATEAGTEVIDTRLVAEVQAYLKNQKPILTPELAKELVKATEVLYQTNDTFILPSADPSAKARILTKDTSWAESSYNHISAINEMICASYQALSPKEYCIPISEIVPEEELSAISFLGAHLTTFLPLTGDFDTPEEAAALIREKSEQITYIKLCINTAELWCGDTCVVLTLS